MDSEMVARVNMRRGLEPRTSELNELIFIALWHTETTAQRTIPTTHVDCSCTPGKVPSSGQLALDTYLDLGWVPRLLLPGSAYGICQIFGTRAAISYIGCTGSVANQRADKQQSKFNLPSIDKKLGDEKGRL